MNGGPALVLCVDDNPQVCAALWAMLRRDARFAWAGERGSADGLVEAAASVRPRIVVLDIDMPGADPLEAVGRLRERSPDTLVVVFSGHSAPALVQRALDAGAWGYVSKNDGPDRLMEAFEAALAGEIYLSPEPMAAMHHAPPPDR